MSLLLQPLQCAVRLLHAAKSTLALVPSDHVLLVTMATVLILLASSTQLPIALCSNHFPPGLWNCSSLGSVSFSESSPAGLSLAHHLQVQLLSLQGPVLYPHVQMYRFQRVEIRLGDHQHRAGLLEVRTGCL